MVSKHNKEYERFIFLYSALIKQVHVFKFKENVKVKDLLKDRQGMTQSTGWVGFGH